MQASPSDDTCLLGAFRVSMLDPCAKLMVARCGKNLSQQIHDRTEK